MMKIKSIILENKLSRNEMKNTIGGTIPMENADDGVKGGGNCLVACQVTTHQNKCCSGMVVSGDYPPCGGDRGMVCL